MKPLIQLENVTKVYDHNEAPVHALRGVSFSLAEGEMVSLMGPSGSGKTTCMNLIGCLDVASSGRVLLRGEVTAGLSEKDLAHLRSRHIGFVFQHFHLLPRMSILENVMTPLLYNGTPRNRRRSLASAALARVGLSDRMTHRPNELSGGQKQRAAIARALVTEPSLLLADEPTGALDSQTGQSILELFHRLHEEGRTILIVTHDDQVGASCSRRLRMKDGLLESDSVF